MNDTTRLSILDERPPGRQWTFNQKVIAGILTLIVGVPSLLFGLFILHAMSMDSEQKVAGEVTLTPAWVEFTPARPLKTTRQWQTIILDVAEPLMRDNSNLKRVRLLDGAEIKPEVELVTQYGDVAPVELWRTLTPSRYGNAVSGYAPDAVFVKVRVRCDKPLRLRGIVWHSWDGK